MLGDREFMRGLVHIFLILGFIGSTGLAMCQTVNPLPNVADTVFRGVSFRVWMDTNSVKIAATNILHCRLINDSSNTIQCVCRPNLDGPILEDSAGHEFELAVSDASGQRLMTNRVVNLKPGDTYQWPEYFSVSHPQGKHNVKLGKSYRLRVSRFIFVPSDDAQKATPYFQPVSYSDFFDVKVSGEK
jgi:hypothetical protein